MDQPQPDTPRQTQSYLRTLFEERNIRPQSKRGQNFLIDLNLLDFILRAAELSRDDLALEVGSGTGGLTVRLAQAAGGVLSVEIDDAFARLTREIAGELPNVVLLHTDVLKNKNELNPDVLTALGQLQRQTDTSRVKLVANLPYAVATPVIANLLLAEGIPLTKMIVTVQWEIAERLIAQPSTKDYGALAVLVQSLAKVNILRRLPPAVFWPRPQVASAIVRIVPNSTKRDLVRSRVGELLRFRNFLRDLYSHRRKNLRGALIGAPTGRRDKREVDEKLGQLGLDGRARAESLDIEAHLRLCEAFG